MMLPGAPFIKKTGHQLNVHWNWRLQMKKSIPKKLITALLSLSLVIPPSAVVANSIPDEQFTFTIPNVLESTEGILVEDSQFLRGRFASLQSFTADGNIPYESKLTGLFNCQKYNDANCGADKYMLYLAPLGFCGEMLKFDCVNDVYAENEAGNKLLVKFLQEFPGKTSYDFQGSVEANLPTGSSTFLVDIPEAPHQGGTKYLVSVAMEGFKSFDQSIFKLNEMRAGIFAVSLDNQSQFPAAPLQSISYMRGGVGVPNYQRLAFLSNSQPASCVQATRNICANAWPLPTSIKFGLQLKLRTKISGWLHGRVYNPNANLTIDIDGDQILDINGYATKVPILYGWLPVSRFTAGLKNFYEMNPKMSDGGTGTTTNGIKVMLHDSNGYNSKSFDEAVAWIDALGDKASHVPTEWAIRTMESGTGGNVANSCFEKKENISGIVSTNATSFIAGPPTFNYSEKSLDYKVAAPHYLPNGEEFKGTYTLNIRSDVARCLYGFTSAPISAKVSVISATGSASVATTTLIEKNGWITLSANGFTFSSPTLRVKLTQEKATAKRKITISCVKGKATKKVTGLSPKCPSGYKVK
jgi:hypothetical protein